MFSSRVPKDLSPNRFGVLLSRLRAEGAELVDLTESNPTRAGFDYPPDLLASLASPDALTYRPAPLGLPAAREAVCDYLLRLGVDGSPDRVVLTASTSEAYALLFKLLCDPGDQVLAPRPSYPLFEHLTSLEAVEVRPYPLEYHARWEVDVDQLRQAVTPRTRAVLLVSPNNPTGSYVTRAELEAIADVCAARGLALVGDEVFAGYPLNGLSARPPPVVAHGRDALTISLGGLSKAVGLPQVKLGWMLIGGPDRAVGGALSRLELICDTYLSVSTPVQVAAATLLARGEAVARQIGERVRRNYAAIQDLAARVPSCRVLAAEGGWYAVVRVPATRTEEDLVLDLLARERLVVHPGYFFDFSGEAFLVFSLLVEPGPFDDGVGRALALASR